MTTLIFIDPAQKEHRVEAPTSGSVMQAAVAALVPGIEASCGGNCLCATCHAYIDERVAGQLPPPNDTELAMLECVNRQQPNSRLTCQVAVSAALDGMRIQVADSQH